jgi:hypothetical protein
LESFIGTYRIQKAKLKITYKTWADYVASFLEAGREFSMVSVADWQQQLRQVYSDNVLFGVLGFYLNGFEEDIGDFSLIGHVRELFG